MAFRCKGVSEGWLKEINHKEETNENACAKYKAE